MSRKRRRTKSNLPPEVLEAMQFQVSHCGNHKKLRGIIPRQNITTNNVILFI